ncbi:MAG TPA: sigma-70 family RNA polymerase sigma factor [Solirubrobacteraceae bacterium]|nr:sigma-70 family RNA polymerase sigma factor [Solirubrobacteraceae bacterium]
MSPAILRRYRADRLLREEFETLRDGVIRAVSARLRAAGVEAGSSDLDAAYAQAWQGLYAAVLAGRQIENPAGWLAVVAHRRAIDELRARGKAGRAQLEQAALCGEDRDIADALDDRARLRALLEALRARLSERERQAAALCYLQGLTRAEAAARMGISESRMRKLMEGTGRGLRGVAAKVGALAQAIAAGEWCEQQGSLMRGFAFGVLDPGGERYRIALSHAGECSACRAYVRSLRGLAAILPPSPIVLQWIAASAGGAGATAAGAGIGAANGLGGGSVAGPGGSPGAGFGGSPGAGLGPGVLGAPSAAAGAAGGSWWLAGGVGAKLAVGCVLAAGLGASCVALGTGSQGSRHGMHARHVARAVGARAAVARPLDGPALAAVSAGSHAVRESTSLAPRTESRIADSARAGREFGPERSAASATSSPAGNARRGSGLSAHVARRPIEQLRAGETPSGASATLAGGTKPQAADGAPAAQREFSPG